VRTITSAQIAQGLDIDPTQVRKDFSAIGLVGIGRVGFDVCEVCRTIRIVLGFEEKYEAVLIGTGHLGGALLTYSGFERYGLHIVAAFDNDKRRIGKKIAGCTIKSMRIMKPFIKSHKIRLAILTTPAEVAQELTDRLVSAGVKAIWNFAPTRLKVPSDVLVRNEHISMGLSQIAYHLKD
jgi:redox-sensing transcriptional repressor